MNTNTPNPTRSTASGIHPKEISADIPQPAAPAPKDEAAKQ